MDLINGIEYAGRQQFYILSQQKLLELLFEKYGVEGEMKKATMDNKIQVAGIVFSELREYIPDMLGSLRGSKIRAELDAAASCKLAGFCAMYTKFIDKEVIFMLPEKQTLEETKCSVDGLNFYDWVKMGWKKLSSKNIDDVWTELEDEWMSFMEEIKYGN
jgi:hypothetical protein